MDRKIKELWNCYEKNHDIHTLKWDNFTTFLKDTLETFIHHNQTIATRYEKACQKPGQVVTDFVAYLDRLKDELLPYNNKACLRHLKTKLRPKIINKMIAWPNPSKDLSRSYRPCRLARTGQTFLQAKENYYTPIRRLYTLASTWTQTRPLFLSIVKEQYEGDLKHQPDAFERRYHR